MTYYDPHSSKVIDEQRTGESGDFDGLMAVSEKLNDTESRMRDDISACQFGLDMVNCDLDNTRRTLESMRKELDDIHKNIDFILSRLLVITLVFLVLIVSMFTLIGLAFDDISRFEQQCQHTQNEVATSSVIQNSEVNADEKEYSNE